MIYSRVLHISPKYPASHAVKQEPFVFEHIRQLPHLPLHSSPYEPNVHADEKSTYINILIKCIKHRSITYLYQIPDVHILKCRYQIAMVCCTNQPVYMLTHVHD